MASLKDGRFVFIDSDRRIRVESVLNVDSYRLFYGGEVLAFAISDTQSMIALACPANAATGSTPASGSVADRCCVRTFTVTADGAMGDLLAELEVPLANELVWVGERFVVASHAKSLTTIMELVKGPRLRIFVQDKGLHPFVVSGLLGLVSAADSAAVEMWDLQRNKLVDTIRLGGHRPVGKRRGGDRKGATASQIVSSSCSGSFAVLGRQDGSFETICAAGRGSVKLLSEVRPSPTPQSGEVPTGKARLDHPTRILCASSASRLVVGAAATRSVARFFYPGRGAPLRLDGSATLGEGETLLAVTSSRYLVSSTPVTRTGRDGASRKSVYTARSFAADSEAESSPHAAPVPRNAKGGDSERFKGIPKGNTVNSTVVDDLFQDAEESGGTSKRKGHRRRRQNANGAEDASDTARSTTRASAHSSASSAGAMGLLPAAVAVAGITCAAVAVALARIRRAQ